MTGKEAKEILEEVKTLDDSIYQYNQKYLEALDMAIDALEGIENVGDFLRSAVNIKMALESSLEIEKHNKNVMIKRIIADINDLKALSSTTIMNNRDLLDFVLEIIDKHRKESEDD